MLQNAAGGADIGAWLGQLVGGGVSGAIVSAIVGMIMKGTMVDYLPSTVESLRGTILNCLMSEGELAAALADCRQHLSAAESSFTMYTLAQVLGMADSRTLGA